MRFTEEEIINIANKVLKDIQLDYYKDRPIHAKYVTNFNYFGDDFNKEDGWIVWADWYDPDFLDGKDSKLALIIDDETGIPHQIRLSFGQNIRSMIKTDKNGNYIIKHEPI